MTGGNMVPTSSGALLHLTSCYVQQRAGTDAEEEAGRQAATWRAAAGSSDTDRLRLPIPFDCSAALLTTWPSNCTRVSGCLVSSLGRAARAAKLGWLVAMLLPAACGCVVGVADDVDASLASSKPLMPHCRLLSSGTAAVCAA